MRVYDLVLLHAPALFDFRDRILGPISDVVPSYPIFDMYPIGFLSLATYLIGRGFKVRIANIAAKLVMKNINVRKYVKGLKARIYGIDLHWLIHVNGALELAKIIKELHPSSTVVIGGLSATYFVREILEKEYVDYVVLGDTGEHAIEMLLEGKKLEEIPNLAWKSKSSIRIGKKLTAPQNLDKYRVDTALLVRSAIRSADPFSWFPYANFTSNPIGAVLPYKGCWMNCITCGGSQYAYSRCFFRKTIGLKSPKTVFEEIKSITEYLKIPIFIINDLQVLGIKWVNELVKYIKDENINTTFLLEFFKPPSFDLLSELRKLGENVIVQISPETHDEGIRKRFGRDFSNNELENFIKKVTKLKFERLDLYFMIGLPGQDIKSSILTVKYIDTLFSKYNASRLNAFIAPLAPLLDPGSKAFEEPEKYGYKLLARTLDEHRLLIKKARRWVDLLNYETKWLKREDIAEAFYLSSKELIKVKFKHDLVNEEEYRSLVRRIEAGRKYVREGVLEKETTDIRDLYPSTPLISSLKPLKLALHLPLILMGK